MAGGSAFGEVEGMRQRGQQLTDRDLERGRLAQGLGDRDIGGGNAKIRLDGH